MTQLQGFFEKNFTLSPDYCGASARMSPLAAFTMFQAIAAEHAERIGVGGAAMARRGAFWLTLHSRVDFFSVARSGAGGDGGHMAGALRGEIPALLPQLQPAAGRSAAGAGPHPVGGAG